MINSKGDMAKKGGDNGLFYPLLFRRCSIVGLIDFILSFPFIVSCTPSLSYLELQNNNL